jgi:hypothetical protein
MSDRTSAQSNPTFVPSPGGARGNEALVDFEKIPLDVKQGVEYLKKQGVAKVILLGHSGGGATTSFYQAVAEAGPSYCQGPNKLTPCDNSLAGLPPADGMLLMDGHPSNASNALRAINPAVFNEDRPDLVDPALDPFNPANGYNPEGQSHYPPEFVKRYSEAQAKRMNRWIDRALYIRKLMKEGRWIYPDNDAFIIPRGHDSATNIFALDTSILCCTKRPQRLLKNDGTIVTQIIKSVRPPDTSRAKMNGTFGDGSFNLGGMRVLTVKSFLSANAIRATDSLDYSKIDWCTSNNSVPCALTSRPSRCRCSSLPCRDTTSLLTANTSWTSRRAPTRSSSPSKGLRMDIRRAGTATADLTIIP